MAPASLEGRRIVLDTSIFVNPEVRVHLGKTPTEAMAAFVDIAALIPHVEFYMPPSIFEELMNFVKRKEISGAFLRHVVQKAPERYERSTPAIFLYELIEEMRDRVNRGLRIAEQGVRSAARSGEADETVREVRRKYRDALREGIIDSKEDVDLILLARELDALLVTADQGAAKWADKLGVRWLLPEKFKEYLMAEVREAGA